jgi:hypothetical protein
MSSEAKNLEAISKAIDHHNVTCEYPAVAIRMNPFEVERDPSQGTGSFTIVCARDQLEENEVVEAVAEEIVPIVR